MSVTLQEYAANRAELLEKIVNRISDDDRFVAAWLTGSYASGEQDALSDLDLNLVVTYEHSKSLCHRDAQVSAQTVPARLALFRQFGEIAMLHENNNNAPDGGTFTNTIYADTALVVDWILIPQEKAQRPSASLLLFDRVGIPEEPPVPLETPAQRAEKLSEISAFFWMMMAVTAKYLARGDTDFANNWIDQLQGMLQEIRRLLADETFHNPGDTHPNSSSDCEAQIEALCLLAGEMESLLPEIAASGGFVRPSPIPTLKVLLTFASENCEA